MTVNPISQREFLKGVGIVAAATVLAERAPEPKETWVVAAPKGNVRFGIQTPPQHVAYRDLVSVWQGADELGFDSVFLFDHLMPIYSDPRGYAGRLSETSVCPQSSSVCKLHHDCQSCVCASVVGMIR
jgi:hypothetical protein